METTSTQLGWHEKGTLPTTESANDELVIQSRICSRSLSYSISTGKSSKINLLRVLLRRCLAVLGENPKGCHYIPHFAVHNESETTPIRSSCKTRNVSSLNDCLIIVPPIENKILLRLRIHRIVFSTGTEKAFHWVLLGLPRLCTLFMA